MIRAVSRPDHTACVTAISCTGAMTYICPRKKYRIPNDTELRRVPRHDDMDDTAKLLGSGYGGEG